MHIDELRINLSNQSVDFLALNETRLDCSLEDSHFVINGYDLIRNHFQQGLSKRAMLKNYRSH